MGDKPRHKTKPSGCLDIVSVKVRVTLDIVSVVWRRQLTAQPVIFLNTYVKALRQVGLVTKCTRHSVVAVVALVPASDEFARLVTHHIQPTRVAECVVVCAEMENVSHLFGGVVMCAWD